MATNGSSESSFLEANERFALLENQEEDKQALINMDDHQNHHSTPMHNSPPSSSSAHAGSSNSLYPGIASQPPSRPAKKYNPSAGRDEEGGELTCSGLCPCGTMQGNTLRCYGSQRARYFPLTCIIGPHWPMNLCVWGILLIPGTVYFLFVANQLDGATGIAIFVVSALLIANALLALACTSFSDPGYLPRLTPEEAELERERLEASNELNNRALCKECNQYRTPETHHCHDCDRCCEELDHHCPWMGKDIGKYNLQCFYCFLWSFCISIIFAVITTFVVVL